MKELEAGSRIARKRQDERMRRNLIKQKAKSAESIGCGVDETSITNQIKREASGPDERTLPGVNKYFDSASTFNLICDVYDSHDNRYGAASRMSAKSERLELNALISASDFSKGSVRRKEPKTKKPVPRSVSSCADQNSRSRLTACCGGTVAMRLNLQSSSSAQQIV